jgi:hypothetical protein
VALFCISAKSTVKVIDSKKFKKVVISNVNIALKTKIATPLRNDFIWLYLRISE